MITASVMKELSKVEEKDKSIGNLYVMIQINEVLNFHRFLL